MLAILAITVPIFVLIGAGYLSGRRGIFTAEQFQGMGKFVLLFALPAITFDTLARRPMAEIFEPGYLAAYGLGSLGMFVLTLAFMRILPGMGIGRGAMLALGASSANSAFMGYPIVSQFIGPQAAIALAHSMVIENLVVIPLALALAEIADHRGASLLAIAGKTLANLAKTPLIVALVLGAACSIAGLHPPDMIAKPIEMLAKASAPVALFVIGGGLVGVRLGHEGPRATPIAAAKLILHPLAVTLALLLFSVRDPALAKAAILYAAMPMLSIYPLLAARHNDQRLAAVALLLAVAASFATISFVLWLIERGTLPL